MSDLHCKHRAILQEMVTTLEKSKSNFQRTESRSGKVELESPIEYVTQRSYEDVRMNILFYFFNLIKLLFIFILIYNSLVNQ
jgi:hypothetical protein